MAFKTPEDKARVISQIGWILKASFPSNEKFQERSLDILVLLVDKKVTSVNFALTSPQIAEALPKHPRPSICYSLSALEQKGLVDRRTRNEGWFLSHSFLTYLEKQRSNWRSVLETAGLS